MSKDIHEVRDPIHGFVRLDSQERDVLNSRPFQRLRHIHQLAMTYLVYPGATHKRFEHSLGVMELASRVFDSVMRFGRDNEVIRNQLSPLSQDDNLRYWRRVLRMAALCHDIGHLPFSHAAERELLPEGWDHERLTIELIRSDSMMELWRNMTPPLRDSDIISLAVGPNKADTGDFPSWQAILSEIIVGDAFGVDRMDYLLRDSHHVGVAYGKFDHYRLIDTLRILPTPVSAKDEEPAEPALGIEEGGIHTAEALMLARYFMYSQVYFHPVRRIYDIHLKDFLKEWLSDGLFTTDVSRLLDVTDNEVNAAMLRASVDEGAKGRVHALRIVERGHFKVIYKRHPSDVKVNPEAGSAVFDALSEQFGSQHFRHDRYQQKSGAPDFPVRLHNEDIVSSLACSPTLNSIPVVSVDYVFADSSVYAEAELWLAQRRSEIVQARLEESNNG